jgi:crotonobetainyl-CoA:carnitine CoA-transferase CaiB-like acyl-CoA transferase
MLDASLAFFWSDGMIAHTFLGDETVPGVPLYELYRLWETADGHIIYFAASDVEFEGLFRAVGHPEWSDDERFNSIGARIVPENREALGGLLMEAILSIPTRELLERMAEEEVPVGPVLDLDQIAADPQVVHNEAILEFDHPTAGRYQQARPAARFDKTPQDPRRRMPALHGEHTEEVLRELGYADADLERARGAGVIPKPD